MTAVRHRRVSVDGIDTFYREAGPEDGPVLLLPHGYPASSFAFRALMPALDDRWRTVAPDFPGFGYSEAPAEFSYTFDGYSAFLHHFIDTLELAEYAIYLHDYGSQFGLRLAMAAPERVRGLIIQNGDIYEDQHGPKYAPLKRFWNNPSEAGIDALAAAVSEEGFRDEFRGELPDPLADRVSPDLWKLAWAVTNTPQRRAHLVHLLAEQRHTVPWFPRQQTYLREHRPPTLIAWGRHDGYMPEGAAHAYHRDHPDAELHILDGGHWLLETHLVEVVALVREFLARIMP